MYACMYACMDVYIHACVRVCVYAKVFASASFACPTVHPIIMLDYLFSFDRIHSPHTRLCKVSSTPRAEPSSKSTS